LANLCCCLWAIIGGAVAAYMLIKRSPTLRVMNGEGAMAGLLAGIVASLLFLVIAVPRIVKSWDEVIGEMIAKGEAMNDPASQESIKRMVEFIQNNSVLSAVLVWLIFALLMMGFATLGGLIGVAIFEKRKNQPYPPQWPPPTDGFPPTGFAPPGPPPGGPAPPPGQSPYGGGDAPPY
jgi:Na+/proline symporter